MWGINMRGVWGCVAVVAVALLGSACNPDVDLGTDRSEYFEPYEEGLPAADFELLREAFCAGIPDGEIQALVDRVAPLPLDSRPIPEFRGDNGQFVYISTDGGRSSAVVAWDNTDQCMLGVFAIWPAGQPLISPSPDATALAYSPAPEAGTP